MTPRTLGVVDQLRIASKNIWIMILGIWIGGTVPAGVFVLVHQEVPQGNYWDSICRAPLLWSFIFGGLVVSAKSVCEWMSIFFRSNVKAYGFTLFAEGVMSFQHNPYLSGFLLAILVLINGVAAGCNLVLDRRETARNRYEARTPRELPARKVVKRRPKLITEAATATEIS